LTVAIVPIPVTVRSNYPWLPEKQAYIRKINMYYPFSDVNDKHQVTSISQVDETMKALTHSEVPLEKSLLNFGFWFQLQQAHKLFAKYYKDQLNKLDTIDAKWDQNSPISIRDVMNENGYYLDGSIPRPLPSKRKGIEGVYRVNNYFNLSEKCITTVYSEENTVTKWLKNLLISNGALLSNEQIKQNGQKSNDWFFDLKDGKIK
jgi:hypothetical protein